MLSVYVARYHKVIGSHGDIQTYIYILYIHTCIDFQVTINSVYNRKIMMIDGDDVFVSVAFRHCYILVSGNFLLLLSRV